MKCICIVKIVLQYCVMCNCNTSDQHQHILKAKMLKANVDPSNCTEK